MADLVGATEVEETGKWKQRRKVYVDTNVSPQRILDAFVLVDETGAQTGIASNPLITNAEMKIGNTVTDGTEGSILFVGASAVLEQDNANLFWNDTDNRLGVGISVPLTAIHVDSNAANTVAIATLENTAGNIQLFRSDATPEAAITGSIGDLAIDGTGGKIYLKETGSSTNTGWVQIGSGGGGGLGTNLTSTTNDIVSDTGTIALGTTGDILDIIGNLTLEDTISSTTGVILKGADRFLHNFHHPTGGGAIPDGLNTFVGADSGNFTMGSTATQVFHASRNVGVGVSTLKSLTTGYFNMAMGEASLNNCTTGNSNVSVGKSASLALTTGVSNVAVGREALFGLLTGDSNIGIGRHALRSVTDGSDNVAIGLDAGRRIGGGAGLNTTSDFCVLIGSSTDISVDGVQRETVIGYNAIGKGEDTVILGAEGANIAVYVTGGLIVNDEGNDVDSRIEGSTDPNAFYLDASANNSGFGTDIPLTKLHVDSNAADTVPILTVENTGGDFQVFRDDASPESVITGSPGDLCIDSTGGDAYIKKTGAASNTGWLRLNTNGFVLQTLSNSINPADSTTYFTGGLPIAISTSAGIQKISIPKTGTVTAIYVTILNATVQGTTETSTMSFRLNDTSDTTISAVIQNDLLVETFSNTGLSVAVTAGDFFELKWVTPAWATNPEGVFISASVHIE